MGTRSFPIPRMSSSRACPHRRILLAKTRARPDLRQFRPFGPRHVNRKRDLDVMIQTAIAPRHAPTEATCPTTIKGRS
jgi:hypothetical protein